MTAVEALRQCIEAMKLIDFKDCAESAELWHKFNLAQANAERVLRDGEKQEPVGYDIFYDGEPCRHNFPTLERAEKHKAHMDANYPGYARIIMPLYTHPAPSLQAAPRLPSTPEEAVAFIGSHFGSMDVEGPLEDRQVRMSIHDLLSAFRDWQDFPPDSQPTAAPSGDVEREETDWDWIHAPPNKPGIYLHRHPVYKGVDKRVFVGWVSALEPLNQGMKRPQYAIHMRVCPVDEPLHMDRLTPEAWGGMWKKIDDATKE